MRGLCEAFSRDSIGAGAGAGWRRSSMYACINCLIRLSVGTGGGARAGPYAEVSLGLADVGAGVPKSVSEELKLLDRVDLLESSLARLRATL